MALSAAVLPSSSPSPCELALPDDTPVITLFVDPASNRILSSRLDRLAHVHALLAIQQLYPEPHPTPEAPTP